MNKNEIIEKLKSLQVEIRDYANYLEESTYHPYDQVEHFAYELVNLIKEIECNYILTIFEFFSLFSILYT